MKKLSLYLLTSLILTSCAGTYQEIGSLSMLSDRKVDPNGRYCKLSTAAGSSKKEIKKASTGNIEDAIDQVLDQVPGGRYLTNVKIYVVHGEYLAVSGDVWGQPCCTSASKEKANNVTLGVNTTSSYKETNKVADMVNSFDSGSEGTK